MNPGSRILSCRWYPTLSLAWSFSRGKKKDPFIRIDGVYRANMTTRCCVVTITVNAGTMYDGNIERRSAWSYLMSHSGGDHIHSLLSPR